MAAEWAKENIAMFGGDPDNITLAGRSAGAYSVEAQMLYDFRKPGPKTSLFQRVFMNSNAVPAQPKSLEDTAVQFDEVCGYFKIDEALPAAEKLAQLRKISTGELIEAIPKLDHTLRPVTDDLFIHPGMTEYLKSRHFSNKFKNRGYKMLIGEVANEETLFRVYNSPTEPTEDALKVQVMNYYSPKVAERVIPHYDLPKSEDVAEWKRVFGMTPASAAEPQRNMATD